MSKFSLFTREVELASEFTSLANMHKELDLSKFMTNEPDTRPASDDALETFDADHDTLHDLWLQSLNRESTKVRRTMQRVNILTDTACCEVVGRKLHDRQIGFKKEFVVFRCQ